jgi:hypothetical protein
VKKKLFLLLALLIPAVCFCAEQDQMKALSVNKNLDSGLIREKAQEGGVCHYVYEIADEDYEENQRIRDLQRKRAKEESQKILPRLSDEKFNKQYEETFSPFLGMESKASQLGGKQVSLLQLLLKEFISIKVKLDIENKKKEILGQFTENYIFQVKSFDKHCEKISLKELSVFLRVCSVAKSLEKSTEKNPLLLFYSSPSIKKDYDTLYRLSKLIAPESLELQECCLLERARHYLSATNNIQEKMLLGSNSLGIPMSEYKNLLSQYPQFKNIIAGLVTARRMAVNFKQTYAQETSEYFVVENGKLYFKDSLFKTYEYIYQPLARRNKPSFLRFEFNGVKYQFPKTLDGEILVAQEAQKPGAVAEQVQEDTRDIETIMAEFGLSEEVTLLKSKKGKQQQKKQQTKKKADRGSQKKKKQKETASSVCAIPELEGVVCHLNTESVQVNEQNIYYTRAARSWLKNPEVRLSQDGYLNEKPETKEQQKRRKIFERIMRIKQVQKEEACRLITADHSLPPGIDKYLLDQEDKVIQMRDNEFSLKVPVCRTYKGQEGKFQMGEYELFFHKRKNGHIHVYHRLFKEIEDKQLFLQQNISQTVQKIDIEALIEASQLEAAIEEGQAKWQPAEGTWNIDASNELFIKFEDTKSDMEYYLFR